MLRVAILDDHAAVLAGLRRFFDPQHYLSVIAAAATVAELSHQLDGTRADVLVLAYDRTRSDGLSHCQRSSIARVRPQWSSTPPTAGTRWSRRPTSPGRTVWWTRPSPCSIFSPLSDSLPSQTAPRDPRLLSRTTAGTYATASPGCGRLRRHLRDACSGRRAGAQVETAAPRRNQRSAAARSRRRSP